LPIVLGCNVESVGDWQPTFRTMYFKSLRRHKVTSDRPKCLQTSQNPHKIRGDTTKETLATVRLKTLCLSVCLYACLSVCLSVSLCVSLSVCPLSQHLTLRHTATVLQSVLCSLHTRSVQLNKGYKSENRQLCTVLRYNRQEGRGSEKNIKRGTSCYL